MDFEFDMKTVFLSVIAQIVNLACFCWPSRPQPQPGPATTTVVDLESQQEMRCSPSLADAQSQIRDARYVILPFCFSSVLEIAFNRSAQPIIRHHEQLPGILDLLSLSIVLTFSALFVSKFIHSRFQMIVQFLEKFAIFFSVTAFFIAASIQLPLYLKFANWAIYAVSLFTIWFSNKSARWGFFFSS